MAWSAGWRGPRDGVVRGRVRSVDLVMSLRQAGVDRGDLVGLVISPDAGFGVATAERAWPAAPASGLAAVGGRVGQDGGAPGRRRRAAGRVLGQQRGAPDAVRRLAGRSRLGLGPGP